MFQQQQPFNPYTQQLNLANSQLANRMQMPNGYGYNNYNSNANNLPIVNDRASAEMYVMPPNSRAILMDRNLPRIYLKETDAANQYRLTAYDLVEVKEEQPQSVEYITRQEFEEWKRAFTYEPSIRTEQQQSVPVATATIPAATTEESRTPQF